MPVEIVTFGCRLNTYETEVMRNHAAAAGKSNAIVFNTCAVTAEATRQARQAIRKGASVADLRVAWSLGPLGIAVEAVLAIVRAGSTFSGGTTPSRLGTR